MHWWAVMPLPGAGTSFVVALAVAGVGHARRALTRGGAITAVGVGTIILAASGWAGGAALAVFFVLGSALARVLPVGAPRDGDAKGEQRDAWQVLANGGTAALAALLARAEPSLALWMVTTSLAAAAADTWATAIGSTSPSPPRRLLLGKVVSAGTNGGMTWRGCAGAVGGALSVAAAAAFVAGDSPLWPWATALGVAGMALDSLMGATLQGRHRCDACGTPSDWRVHRCGSPTRHEGGVAWLDNDGVNLVTTGTAALAGALAWWCACA